MSKIDCMPIKVGVHMYAMRLMPIVEPCHQGCCPIPCASLASILLIILNVGKIYKLSSDQHRKGISMIYIQIRIK